MKALVTGVAGFVGSRLARRLLNEGHSVVGIDSFSDYYDPAIKEANVKSLVESESFEFVQADLNKTDLNVLLKGTDVVFHQAGQPGVRKSWGADFSIYLDANVFATQRLLEAAKESNLQRFVYASSSSVYGNAKRYPTSESDIPAPLSPYGVTKLAAEHLCNLYASNFGVPTVSLRYFTVYGPGQRPDMAFTRFAKAAVRSEPIHIFGDGEQVRDFTYVDDVVDANILAGSSSVTAGSVYNVAGGTSISVNGVLNLFKQMNNGYLDVRYIDKVAGDVGRTGGNVSKISAELGWKARTSLEEGVSSQLRWAREVF